MSRPFSLPARSAPAAAGSTGLLVVLCAALFLDALDLSVVGVTLPSIQRDLDVPTSTLQWVVSGYVLGYGGFLLLGGRAADLLGRRRVFLIAIGVFAAASLLGALATSPELLIGARFVKGVSAAFTAPAALSILTTTYQEGPERSRALGLYGATGASGFSFGLVLGGLLTGTSWRLVFLLPVPIALLVLAGARKVIAADPPRSESSGHYDGLGAVTATGGLVLLVYTVTQAPDHGWASGRTIALFVATALLLAGFVATESRVAHPLLPLSIFRNRALTSANLVALAFFGAYSAFQFVATLYLQDMLGWSALKTALAFLPAALIIAVLSPRVGPLAERVGVGRLLVSGMALMAIGYALFVRAGEHSGYVAVVLPTMLLIGLGCAAVFTSVNIAAVSGVDDKDQGLAGGLVNTSMQTGAGIMVAVATAIVTSQAAAHQGSRPTQTAADLLAGYHPALLLSAALAAAGMIAAVVGFARRPAAAPASVVRDDVVVEAEAA